MRICSLLLVSLLPVGLPVSLNAQNLLLGQKQGGALPTPALIQQSGSAGNNCKWVSGTTYTCAMPGASTQTNALLAKIAVYNNTGTPSVSSLSSANATWTILQQFPSGATSDGRQVMACAVFSAVPGTQTVTITLSSASVTASLAKIQEFSGLANCTPDGTVHTNGGSATTATAPSLTTSAQANELVIAACANDGQYANAGPTNGFTADTGWGAPVAGNFYLSGGYLITSATGVQSGPAWTLASSTPWNCQTVAFP